MRGPGLRGCSPANSPPASFTYTMNCLKKAVLSLALAMLVAKIAPAQTTTLVAPQGRLTLVQSDGGVMQNDVTGANTVYYERYVGNLIPISNSTSATFVEQAFTTPLVMTLESTAQTRNNIYDLFAFMYDGGGPYIGAGPAWADSTHR